MKRKSKITAHALEMRIFWIFITSIIVLLGLYGYFVSKSIVNIIIREEIEQDLARVNSHISALEFDYIEKKNIVNLELAYELGFEDISSKTFVARKSLLSKRLTLSDEI